MPSQLTRRAAARLMILGPAALGVVESVRAEPTPPAKRKRPGFSASERREMEKSVQQLRKTIDAVRKVEMPMGSAPAFFFHPILSRR